MQTKVIRGVSFAVILSALVMPKEVTAGVFFGDIAGNQVASGYEVGPGGGVNNAIAEGFTMTQSYDLTSVDINISGFTAGTGSSLALSIYSNNGSNNPGSDLYDLSTNVTGSGQVNFSGTGSFLLSAGTTYWLDLYATNSASPTGNSVQWDGVFTPGNNPMFVNPMGVGATDVGQLQSIQSGNPPTGTPDTSDLRTAFQLNGNLVPEPSTVILAAFGLVSLAALGWRRRRR